MEPLIAKGPCLSAVTVERNKAGVRHCTGENKKQSL